MNTIEEQPLENTVVLPTLPNIFDAARAVHSKDCFFCRKEFNTEEPQIQLSCKCRFHTSCYFERQFVLIEDGFEFEDNRTGFVQLYLRNNCPICQDTIYKQEILQETIVEQVVQEIIDEPIIARPLFPEHRHRHRRNRTDRDKTAAEFIRKYATDKKFKKDLINYRKTITVLRKGFAAYDKKRRDLSKGFQTEIDPLKKLIQQIQKRYLSQLNTVEELKAWKSARSRVEYYKRKLVRDYEITDFNGFCRIKEMRLPNRWAFYRLLTGGRYYHRRYRLFGCRI